jgi:hypothetical protein
MYLYECQLTAKASIPTLFVAAFLLYCIIQLRFSISFHGYELQTMLCEDQLGHCNVRSGFSGNCPRIFCFRNIPKITKFLYYRTSRFAPPPIHKSDWGRHVPLKRGNRLNIINIVRSQKTIILITLAVKI